MGTKTGPKPLPPKEFAARHAERLNYKLVEVLEARKFRVRCLACQQCRIISLKNGNVGPVCACSHNRKFYRHKRTPETHTKELRDLGFKGYTCTKVLDSKRFEYQHQCGHRFVMSRDCFVQCKVPCAPCRPSATASFADIQCIARSRGITFRFLERPVGLRGRTRIKFACGHTTLLRLERLTRASPDALNKCCTCYPNRAWFEFTVNGKEFKTRSLVEKAFVEWLAACRNAPLDKVEYEPRARVRYFNPVKEREAYYTPDFKVGKAMVEVKDESSLYGRNYRGLDQQEVLIENRAKMKAASTCFPDFRVYVKQGQGFVRVPASFWGQ